MYETSSCLEAMDRSQAGGNKNLLITVVLGPEAKRDDKEAN